MFVLCLLVFRLLHNMYTQPSMEVKLNDSGSDLFLLLNGVKWVPSPILFTVYMDGLLDGLKQPGLVCHICGRI